MDLNQVIGGSLSAPQKWWIGIAGALVLFGSVITLAYFLKPNKPEVIKPLTYDQAWETARWLQNCQL